MKAVSHVISDNAYTVLETSVSKAIAMCTGPIFTTNIENLFSLYLDKLPRDRQHYNCNACRRFVNKYGGLVQIDAEGFQKPILWCGDHPSFFAEAVTEMFSAVALAKVTSVLINDEQVWGVPNTGEWTHLCGVPQVVYTGKVRTASQVAADKTQDFGILRHGLADYKIDVVAQAVRILEADALDRSEKTLGVAKWFYALHQTLATVKGRNVRDNLIWRAVATAPPGWCHIRSSMISTLLEALKKGEDFDQISLDWNKRMHPLKYQRPTAKPSEGLINQANAVVEKLAAAGALKRRFARFEETVCFWKPSVLPESTVGYPAGVFDHLKSVPTNPCKDIELPAVKMTWTRFAELVLPKALEISIQAPWQGTYFGLVTASNPEAPAILQWDNEPRNPVSWFFFDGGSRASAWSLMPSVWTKVTGIMKKPCHWYGPMSHHDQGAFLILEGAKLKTNNTGGSFFPECLKTEYNGIRKVMEAYARSAIIEGAVEGTANGIGLQEKGDYIGVLLKVRDASGVSHYTLDRWI